MNTTTCKWRGCHQPGDERGYCHPHYCQLRDAGLLRGGLRDATPARDLIRLQLALGRTLYSLEQVTGLGRESLSEILTGETAQIRVLTQDAILAAPLRPSHIGCLRRYQAMARHGYTVPQISAMAGIPRRTFEAALRRGTFSDDTAERLRVAFDGLRTDKSGPSPNAAGTAARKGYAPMGAWDGIDIDDPDAVPDVGVDTTRSIDETVGEYRHLTGLGVTPEKTAGQLGVELETIERAVLRLRERGPRVGRRCAWHRCGQWFTPRRANQRYHTAVCKRAAIRASHRADTSRPGSTPPGKEAAA